MGDVASHPNRETRRVCDEMAWVSVLNRETIRDFEQGKSESRELYACMAGAQDNAYPVTTATFPSSVKLFIVGVSFGIMLLSNGMAFRLVLWLGEVLCIDLEGPMETVVCSVSGFLSFAYVETGTSLTS